jgi:hypothetical protein
MIGGTYLKKTKNLSKAISKTENSFKMSRATSSEETKLFTLPPIEKKLYKKAILQPTSILTRYIEKHTHDFLKNTEEDLNRPIVIVQKIKTKKKKETKEEGEEEEEKEEEDEKDKQKNDIKCLTERARPNKFNKFNKKLLYLTEASNMNNKSSRKITSKNNSSNKNIEINTNASIQNLLNSKGKNKINIPDSIKVDEELSFEKMKKLEKCFRRIKSYQPKIYTDWKSKCGLSVTIGNIVSPTPVQNDIEYQSKVFHDQAKLLEDNILYYKMNITTKNNYIESFKSLPLTAKISYNKALEETIGIILLLPQLILLDFYKFIKKFENISIPKKYKFEEKYIFDEVENLYFNNNLLSEVLEFFQNCFDVYLLLINEVEDMSLKPKNYNNVMTSFEKARYNICYVINSSENAITNYNKDLRSINKFNKSLGITNNIFDKNHKPDKFMNQFIFKKNAERQRKMRIEACLNYRKEEEDTDFFFSNKKNSEPRIKFKSIVDSELVSKLLKNCREEAKHKITTERINNEIDGGLGEEGEILKNSKRQVIKLNF